MKAIGGTIRKPSSSRSYAEVEYGIAQAPGSPVEFHMIMRVSDGDVWTDWEGHPAYKMFKTERGARNYMTRYATR